MGLSVSGRWLKLLSLASPLNVLHRLLLINANRSSHSLIYISSPGIICNRLARFLVVLDFNYLVSAGRHRPLSGRRWCCKWTWLRGGPGIRRHSVFLDLFPLAMVWIYLQL